MKRTIKILGAAGLLLALSACVAGSKESQYAVDGGLLSQLALGFWHGLIAPATLIVEVINVLAPHLLPWQARLYETKGTGAVYDVGFYFGLAGSPIVIRTGWTRRARTKHEV